MPKWDLPSHLGYFKLILWFWGLKVEVFSHSWSQRLILSFFSVKVKYSGLARVKGLGFSEHWRLRVYEFGSCDLTGVVFHQWIFFDEKERFLDFTFWARFLIIVILCFMLLVLFLIKNVTVSNFLAWRWSIRVMQISSTRQLVKGWLWMTP